MSTILFKRSNTAGNNAYTGLLGEITIDTQARKLRIHDGIVAGGYAAANMTDIQNIIDRIDGLTIADIAGLQDALNAIETSLDNKVDKVVGKQLSTEDFTTAEKTKLAGIEAGAEVNTVDSVAGKTGVVTLVKGDVGLGNVDNTSDLNKPISTATQTALNAKINSSEKGAANGVAPLNSSGKIDNVYLSDALLGQVVYQGTWDASTNTPTLPDPTTVKGHYYVTSVAGTQFSLDFQVGDWVISNGVQWQKVDNTDAVTSVAGKTGAVTLVKADVGLANVDNTSDLNKPISTATQTALDGKVDKVAGKQLSTEDFTTAEKTKLAGIEAGAEVNTVDSVAGKTGVVTLVKGDVGLGNVENYAIASEAENIAGSSNVKYATPKSIRDFVEGGDYVIDLGTF